MKDSAKLLCVGLALVTLRVGDFTYLWGARDRGLVEESTGTDPLIGCALNVERGHVYEVSISAVDSAGLPWNKVDVEASVSSTRGRLQRLPHGPGVPRQERQGRVQLQSRCTVRRAPAG